MSRACYLAIFLSLIIVMTACQSDTKGIRAAWRTRQCCHHQTLKSTSQPKNPPKQNQQLRLKRRPRQKAILSLSGAINLHNHRQPKSARKKCAQS